MSFLHEVLELRETQQCRGYRPGWIWHQLQQRYRWFSLEELQLIADVLGYQPGWAFHQFKEWGPPQAAPPAPPPLPTKLRQALELLGLKLPITETKLKRAYRQRSIETHPDTGGHHESFIRVNQAYEYLKGHLAVGGATQC